MKFEIFKAFNGQYYWRGRGGDGKTLCHSEGYRHKEAAEHAIQAIRGEAASAAIDDLTQAKAAGFGH
ncbi:MAG: YegP family protein [Alphaproteobacteria bacterium]|jgi:uncharacterized protein YegP (UPF0339 family)|uniref:YegP family protein n=1 Tax=Methyloceanibacter sp. TaxID=1965321 RepID=UPI003562CF9C